MRRAVWRYVDSKSEWRHFGYATVSFGDRPAATLLDIVINKAARRFSDIDPDASTKIINDRYVDDIATGGSAQEVQRMSGECNNPNNKLETNGTLSQILSKGSLKLKTIVTSGEKDTEKIDKLGKNVLGVNWNAPSDLINIGIPTDLIEHILASDINNISINARLLLSIINKPHDLLGLVSPITISPMIASVSYTHLTLPTKA